MNKRILKTLGLVVAFLLVLGVGVAAGGVVVYAMTRADKSIALIGTELTDPEPGIVIASVEPEGPAAEAGVVRGDILLQVDGEAVDDLAELMRVLEERAPGDDIRLTVLHGDDERTLTATLGDHDGDAYLGIVPCCASFGPGREVYVHTAGPGMMVTNVESDGPADRAGLQVGDVIIAVDGQTLDAENDLGDVIAAYEPGDTVILEVERPGEESRDVEVELGEHPDEEGVAYLGVRYRSFPPLDVQLHGYHVGPLSFGDHGWPVPEEFLHVFPDVGDEVEQGAVVRSVAEDSPASAADLREGDVITAIEGETVESPQDLLDALAEHEPGDRVTLTVLRPGETDEEAEELQIEVKLGEHPDEEGAAYLGVAIGGFIRMRRFEHGEWPRMREGGTFEFDFPPGSLDDDEMRLAPGSV